MGKLKDQLAGIAALIAAIIAIGGGFTKYGEITTRLNEIEGRSSVDYSAEIAVLEEDVSKTVSPHVAKALKINWSKIIITVNILICVLN